MPGKYITQQQVKLYMTYRHEKQLSQQLASAKAGFSPRSGATIEQGQHHTQQAKRPRQHKTRTSPIDQVWDEVLQPMLENEPTLQPMTLFLYLQREYQDEQGSPLYDQSVLRTLQRRVSYWKAKNGPDKEVIFPQTHVPGKQSLSDFTHMSECHITINGESFPHMLYHFRLVYSKWSYVKVIQSGESFQALSEGLQEALFHLGGTTEEHRTDSLSAAYKNKTKAECDDITQQYEALCAYYQMTPTRNNKGQSHENGSVESSHGHFKNRVKQELLLRGNRDFDSLQAYETWLHDILLQSNHRNSKNVAIEKAALQPLPAHKTVDYELVSTKISGLSILVVKNMTYSVPSRLTGHTLTLHIYQKVIEAYLGSHRVLSFERKYRPSHGSRYVIDYRHIIHALIKKPRAFRHCQYRDEILPNDTYRDIWCYLDKQEPRDVAPKIMLRLLKLACDYDCEHKLGQYVMTLIRSQKPISIERIEQHFNGYNPSLPTVECEQHSLNNYNQLIPTCYATPIKENHHATS